MIWPKTESAIPIPNSSPTMLCPCDTKKVTHLLGTVRGSYLSWAQFFKLSSHADCDKSAQVMHIARCVNITNIVVPCIDKFGGASLGKKVSFWGNDFLLNHLEGTWEEHVHNVILFYHFVHTSKFNHWTIGIIQNVEDFRANIVVLVHIWYLSKRYRVGNKSHDDFVDELKSW